MTTIRQPNDYIAVRMEDDLRTFASLLQARGGAEATIRDHVRFVRRCERVLGGVDPRIATTDHIRILEDAMGGISERTRRCYIRSWTLFVRIIPEGRGSTDGIPYWRSASCDADMEAFRHWILSAGEDGRRAEELVKYARHCFKVMWEESWDIRPDDVDEDVLEKLSLAMSGLVDNTRIRYLRALGVFVQSRTGRNPWRELTVPDSVADPMAYVYSIPAGTEYESELMAYIGAMEHRGLKRTTIIGKVRSVIACLRALEGAGTSTSVEDVTPEAVEYLRTLLDTVSETTARLYIRHFGDFVEFLTGYNPVREARILWNPDGSLVKRKFIFRREWDRLISIAEDEQRVILLLGALMGLRRAEIADLRLDDFHGGTVTIHGKGHGAEGKVVTMAVPRPVADAISDYLPKRARILAVYGDNSEGHLLVRGVQYPGEPMTPDTVGEIVYSLGKRAGVDLSTHSLRRLYATTLNDIGTDMDSLRRMMRHEDVKTTMRCYLAPDPRRMSEAGEKLVCALMGRGGFPLAQKPVLAHCRRTFFCLFRTLFERIIDFL